MSRLVSLSSTFRMRGGLCMALLARSGQIGTDIGQQLARAERLRDVIVASGGACLAFVAAQRIGRDHDDRDLAQRRLRLELTGGLVAVQHRQLDVHQNEIGMMAGCGGERLAAVLGLEHLVADIRQHVAEDAPVVFLVLHHEDAFRHACAAWRSRAIGSVNEKVEPDPRVDSTQMRPPCISTMRLAMDRPRPLPPLVRVGEPSTCWNSAKMRAWSAWSMPGPVSRTAIVKVPLCADALMVTSPASVNLIALPV